MDNQKHLANDLGLRSKLKSNIYYVILPMPLNKCATRYSIYYKDS